MSLKFYLVGRERRRPSPPAEAPSEERRADEGPSEHYIALRDRRVSRRHAEIYVVGERIFLRDLGSKNGTYVIEGNRKVRLTEGYVRADQVVSFGGHRQCIASLIDPPPRRNGHKLPGSGGNGA